MSNIYHYFVQNKQLLKKSLKKNTRTVDHVMSNSSFILKRKYAAITQEATSFQASPKAKY